MMPPSSSFSTRQSSAAKSATSGSEGRQASGGDYPTNDGPISNPSDEKLAAAEIERTTESLSEEVAEPHPGSFAAIITTPDRSNKHLYITGLRGILVLESFVWTYLQTFIPTLASKQTPGHEYQDLLREIFSVPLWNLSLIQNMFIILSMRTIAVSFLRKPSGRSFGGVVVRRIVRLAIVISVAAGLSILIFTQVHPEYIEVFKLALPNMSIEAPLLPYNGLAAVNSLFLIFWVTDGFFAQAANTFWPTNTLWVLSLIYYQSFTVYFLMVILPYTRPKWHFSGLFVFALGSFWYTSWGWYSATGLFLADLAIDETLKSELKRGLRLKSDHRLPYWVPAIVLAFIGLALKYAFTVRPQYDDKLLVLQPFADLSETTSRAKIALEPYARLDDWLLITGLLVIVELFEPVQYLLSFKPLVWLGERSLSVYVMQCITLWTAGIKLWIYLIDRKDMSISGANAVVLIVGFAAVAVFSEIFYRLIDLPSQWAARHAYEFLIT